MLDNSNTRQAHFYVNWSCSTETGILGNWKMDDDDDVARVTFSGNIQPDGFALWCVLSKLGYLGILSWTNW